MNDDANATGASRREPLAVCLLAAVTLAAASPAQSDRARGAQERERQTRVQIVEHDALLGAKVTNGRDGELRETLGSVSDLVIAAHGELRHAVVDVAGKPRRVSVPWRSLVWHADGPHLALSMTAEALRRLPEFDPEALHRLDRRDAAGAADGGSGNGKGAGANDARRERGAAAEAASGGHRLVLASAIAGCEVYADEDELGSCETLFVEPRSGTLALVTVVSGGVLGIGETEYVIPWSALRHVPSPAGERDEPRLRLDRTAKSLQDAPRLGEAGADVDATAFRARVYECYRVERPAFEPRRPKAGASGKRGADRADRSGRRPDVRR